MFEAEEQNTYYEVPFTPAKKTTVSNDNKSLFKATKSLK